MVRVFNFFYQLILKMKFIIENIQTEIYIILLFIAILFFVSANIGLKNQLAFLISIIFSIIAFIYLQQLSNTRETSENNVVKKFNDDIIERNETNEPFFMTQKFPKKMKYLKENTEFINLIENLRFVKKFEKSRYSDILFNLNLLMKVYIYILSERYDPVEFLPQFIDIRDNIIDMMYSLIIVVPGTFKHTYGLRPHDEIHKSIDKFLIKSREMINVIENFSKVHKKKLYIPDTKYKPYNQLKKLYFY